MNKYWLLLSFLILIIACHTQKTIQQIAIVPINKDTLSRHHSVIDSMMSHKFVFEYLQLKSKIIVTDSSGSKKTVTATIRMKNDSAIWASIGIAGIEGVRVLVTRDSVHIIDRINNEVVNNDFSFIKSLIAMPVTFSDLQNILIGEPVFLSDSVSGFIKTDSSYQLNFFSSTIKNTIQLNADYRLLTMLLVDASTQRTLEATFTQYDSTATKPFSSQRSITLHNPHPTLIEINFSKLKINEPLLFPFNPKEKFE